MGRGAVPALDSLPSTSELASLEARGGRNAFLAGQQETSRAPTPPGAGPGSLWVLGVAQTGAGAPAGSRGHPSHVLPISCPRPGRGQPQGAPSRVLAVCQHRPLRCGVSRRPQERSAGGTGRGGV